MIRYTPISKHRALLTLIRLSVLAVQYSDLLGVETLSQWLSKQTKVIRTEAQSINGAQSSKNSKLKHIVPLSWVFLANPVQECTEVPYNCVLSPVPSQNKEIGAPSPGVSALLYLFNNGFMISHWHHCYVTEWSFGDVMLFWWETHAHAFRCVSSNPLLRACLLVQPCSNFFYWVRDSDPGHTLWHIYKFEHVTTKTVACSSLQSNELKSKQTTPPNNWQCLQDLQYHNHMEVWSSNFSWDISWAKNAALTFIILIVRIQKKSWFFWILMIKMIFQKASNIKIVNTSCAPSKLNLKSVKKSVILGKNMAFFVQPHKHNNLPILSNTARKPIVVHNQVTSATDWQTKEQNPCMHVSEQLGLSKHPWWGLLLQDTSEECPYKMYRTGKPMRLLQQRIRSLNISCDIFWHKIT